MLHYPDGPNIITGVLLRVWQEGQFREGDLTEAGSRRVWNARLGAKD